MTSQMERVQWSREVRPLREELVRCTCTCGPAREPDPREHAGYCPYTKAVQRISERREGGDS